MPTIAIYRNNTLIWHKQFDPPENGRLELDEPIRIEKGDFFVFDAGRLNTIPAPDLFEDVPKPIGFTAAEGGRFTDIYWDKSPEVEEVESIEVDIEFPHGVFEYGGEK